MSISRDDARALIGQIVPLAERESWLLSADPGWILPAEPVFEAVMALCDPPLSEAEFNALADEAEALA